MKVKSKEFDQFNVYENGKIYKGRLSRGEDLIKSMTELVKELGIEAGHIQVLGAVRNATIGYFNQDTTEYKFIEKKEPMEILHCSGNISLLNNEPMIHAHIILGDENGKAFGGHLSENTEIYVAEVILKEFIGEPKERVIDKESGLTLWET
ncbi:MAG: PPC domain-containing DNA-binding protein [Halanaerobiales bacterium]